jgi:hypothetical protein
MNKNKISDVLNLRQAVGILGHIGSMLLLLSRNLYIRQLVIVYIPLKILFLQHFQFASSFKEAVSMVF